MISVLDRIREETRPLHDAIERDSRLSRQDFDGAGYRWSLQKLLGFHAPLEEQLKPLSARHGLAGEFGLSIVNVLGLPARSTLPILGLDLVAVAEAPVVVVADLSPDPAGGTAPVWGRARPAAGFPPTGPLPAWCARWFSPAAPFTRVPPADLPDALAVALDAATAWTREVAAAGGARDRQPPPRRPPHTAATIANRIPNCGSSTGCSAPPGPTPSRRRCCFRRARHRSSGHLDSPERSLTLTCSLWTVLVIDDDEVSRYLLRRALQGTPYRVLEAADGAVGLRLARTATPQVIFLDLVMPGVPAFDVIDELKLDPRTRNIPIIIHSSKTLDDDERRRLEEGTAAILPKQSLSREVAAGPHPRRAADGRRQAATGLMCRRPRAPVRACAAG